MLWAQESKARGEAVAAMKLDGIEYEERMERLEEVTWPKPLADLLEVTLSAYRHTHPWISPDALSPKSIVREMYEQGMTFNEFISAYGLSRSEGLLLRYLTDAYRTLRHTVPESHRTEECTRVQDAYSLRCAPQVAGGARDTIDHATRVAEWELAAAVDNPVVTLDGRVESNGNFHGAPVGYVLDFLAIIAADVASISERRTDRFLDRARSHGLPPFLASDPGVDSGHMIAQYTQASIVSEMKRLAVPASVDSIPSSAMQEDHVSMGWNAARKLRRSVDGLSRVVAVEVLTAARALDLRAPLAPSPATAAARSTTATASCCCLPTWSRLRRSPWPITRPLPPSASARAPGCTSAW